RALHSDNLDEILHEACRLVAEGLGAHFAKVLELQPDGSTLLVRAGVGWQPGVVGQVTLSAGEGSPEGHALLTGKPVVCTSVADEKRFPIPRFVVEHGVASLVNVVVLGADGRPPYGVLEVDSREQRNFADADISFLRTYANMLAAAIERLRAENEVRHRAADNERLLRELQHRVKNNLQVIVGLVQLQLRRAARPETWQALRAVGNRIDALRLLHDKLYVSGEVDRVDLGAYLADVAGTLLRFHEPDGARIQLVLDVKDITVSPEQAAPLGLLANEFITNSLKYAFRQDAAVGQGEGPGDGQGDAQEEGQGTIGLRLEAARGGGARLTLWDDGKGLPLDRSGGTGMRMIDSLARQLATRTEWSSGSGQGTRLSMLIRPPKWQVF
ncbi:MAG: hypothetical protein JWP04_3887, partial [Belnapia sp.]|nr:hypothetical protein [Belnapia sp.]